MNELLKSQVVKKGEKSDYLFWNWPGEKSDRTGWRQMYATCLNCLTLEVYYRHLPTYKAPTKTDMVTSILGETTDTIEDLW